MKAARMIDVRRVTTDDSDMNGQSLSFGVMSEADAVEAIAADVVRGLDVCTVAEVPAWIAGPASRESDRELLRRQLVRSLARYVEQHADAPGADVYGIGCTYLVRVE